MSWEITLAIALALMLFGALIDYVLWRQNDPRHRELYAHEVVLMYGEEWKVLNIIVQYKPGVAHINLERTKRDA